MHWKLLAMMILTLLTTLAIYRAARAERPEPWTTSARVERATEESVQLLVEIEIGEQPLQELAGVLTVSGTGEVFKPTWQGAVVIRGPMTGTARQRLEINRKAAPGVIFDMLRNGPRQVTFEPRRVVKAS